MVAHTEPLAVMRKVALGSAVPWNAGIASLVVSPLLNGRTPGDASSTTLVMTGLAGDMVSTVTLKVAAGLSLPAASTATKVKE